MREDGTIATWGMTDPQTGNNFVAISAGAFHNLALRADGTIAAWGDDQFGKVSGTPTGSDFVAVSAGGTHSLALREDGTIAAWGSDADNQVSETPVGNDFVAVSASRGFKGNHSLALREDGTIAAWGRDDGSTFDFGQVTETPTGDGFIAVSAGLFHSLAIKGAPPGALQLIQMASDEVQALQDAGTLNDGEANSLQKKLSIAAALINGGKQKPACNLLGAMINEVEALVTDGRLTAEEGAVLIDLAEEAILDACG